MGGTDRPMHYVCTLEEAQRLVAGRDRFWLSECGCRAARGRCARSGHDVCLGFAAGATSTPTGRREVNRAVVDALLTEASAKHLVIRPFRDEATRTRTEGICLCCDDCCGYFLGTDCQSDRGEFVEATDFGACTHCGECVAVCYFGARRMAQDRHADDPARCYGCGLCVDACPSGCITLRPRSLPDQTCV